MGVILEGERVGPKELKEAIFFIYNIDVLYSMSN